MLHSVVFSRWGCLAACGMILGASPPAAAESDVQRGEYLVRAGGCHDCHSPKLPNPGPGGPQPDPARLLSGYAADSKLPPVPSGAFGPKGWGGLFLADLTAWAGPWGVSFAANLTPDPNTGLGRWTEETFIRAMRTGRHVGSGRPILPPMPWWALAGLTDSDLKAIFAYLRTVRPVRNAVPAPIPPG